MIERKLGNHSPVPGLGGTGYHHHEFGGYNHNNLAVPGGTLFSPPPLPVSYGASPIPPSSPPVPLSSSYGAMIQSPPPNNNGGYVNRVPPPRLSNLSAVNPLYHHRQDTHYVDLNRSSISPFQATQYAEISDRLKATESQHAQPSYVKDDESPFSDPGPVESKAPVLPEIEEQGATFLGGVFEKQRESRVESRASTIYDPADAYGGI